MNIMCLLNKAYISTAKVFFASLFNNNSQPIDVYIFYSELSDSNIIQFERYCQQWNNKRMIFIPIDLEMLSSFHSINGFPVEIFYRLICIDTLSEKLDKILSLDLDMVIKSDISDLYNTDISGYALAACQCIYGTAFELNNQSRLNLPNDSVYFNAGMMLINLMYIREQKYNGNNLTNAMLNYARKHLDKLEWPEQDVLNVFFHNNYKLLDWKKYNCVPIPYIMKSEDVNKNIFTPLTKSQLKETTDFSGFSDYTQALAEQAHIIHYIGTTKPWKKNRPHSQTYDIFDSYYYTYENEAFDLFDSANSKEGRLILFVGVHDTLDIFMYELNEEFQKLGYKTLIYDTTKSSESLIALSDFIKKPVKAAITFNNLGFNMELTPGHNIWEDLNIPIINILMDHPYMHTNALNSAPHNSIVLCIDKNHMNYLTEYFPEISIVGFLPHGGSTSQTGSVVGSRSTIKCTLSQTPLPLSSRNIDVLYTGGISTPFIDNVKPDFDNLIISGENANKLETNIYNRLMNSPSLTFEEIIKDEVINTLHLNLDNKEMRNLIADMHYIEMLVTSEYRKKVIKTLVESGIKVTLYGSGWESCDWINNPNLNFKGRVSAYDAVQLMGNAKIVLNTMTWFKNGAHDRIFNGMLQGALTVTDTSVYMEDNFNGYEGANQNTVLFRLEEIDKLPEKINYYLNNLSVSQKIADRGREETLAHHIWSARARELHNDLLSQI